MVQGFKRILIAHPEQNIRDWIFVTLHRKGYVVKKAGSLRDVLDMHDDGRLGSLDAVITGFSFGQDRQNEGYKIATFFRDKNASLPLLLYLPTELPMTDARRDFLSIFDKAARCVAPPSPQELALFEAVLTQSLIANGNNELLEVLGKVTVTPPSRCDKPIAGSKSYEIENTGPFFS
jgi:hypothetical protein